MRTQAQVDAQHMAVAGARRQDFGHPPRDPHRRLARIVARTARQCFGVEDQYRVDVRRVIEFVAAELAKRDHRQPARRLVRHALGKGGGERGVARRIGETGQQRSEEHTSELQSLMRHSYAVLCLKKKTKTKDKYVTLK